MATKLRLIDQQVMGDIGVCGLLDQRPDLIAIKSRAESPPSLNRYRRNRRGCPSSPAWLLTRRVVSVRGFRFGPQSVDVGLAAVDDLLKCFDHARIVR